MTIEYEGKAPDLDGAISLEKIKEIVELLEQQSTAPIICPKGAPFGTTEPVVTTTTGRLKPMTALEDIYETNFGKFSKIEDIEDTEEAGPVEPAILEAPKVIELKEGQVLLSELVGLPTSDLATFAKQDPAVTVFKAEDWPEELRPFIPDPDPLWFWAPSQLKVACAIALNLEHPDRPILVVGDAGVGKTAMDRQMCALTRRPYVRLGGSEGIEQAILTGWNTVTDKGMEFVEGIVKWAHRLGARLSVDEIFKFPAPVVTGTFQWMLENGGKLLVVDAPGTYGDKLQEPGESFRFLATDNVLGQGEKQDLFAATHIQDSSTLDRFRYVVRMQYMSVDEEKRVLENSGMRTTMARTLAIAAAKLRELYANSQVSTSISLRGLFAISEEVQEGLGLGDAFVRIMGNRYLDDSEREAVSGVWDRVFGTKLTF